MARLNMVTIRKLVETNQPSSSVVRPEEVWLIPMLERLCQAYREKGEDGARELMHSGKELEFVPPPCIALPSDLHLREERVKQAARDLEGLEALLRGE